MSRGNSHDERSATEDRFTPEQEIQAEAMGLPRLRSGEWEKDCGCDPSETCATCVSSVMRSISQIRATGAAWVTEAELEWLCDQAEKPRAAPHYDTRTDYPERYREGPI